MSKWLQVKLGDIADFSNGINFDKSSYCENGTYLIGVSDFGEELFPDYSTLRHIDSTIVRECNLLKDGDIVFVRSNGNKALVGRSMLIKNPPKNTSFSGFCIRARIKNHESFDPLFFAYLFKNEKFRKAIAGCSIGANIQNLSQGKLASYMAYVPSIEIQRKIADILSAYDDLIENNRKQIKLLEEAAQWLYKEWFIDLRFPGHETTPIIDGIPAGWEKRKLGNWINTFSGGTPSRKNKDFYQAGTNYWIKTQELTDGFIFETEEKITDNAIKASSAKYIYPNSILMAMYGATIGKLGIAATVLTCNQACCVFDLSSSLEKMPYLYMWLKINRDFFISQGIGSAQSNLSQAMIKNFDIIVPTLKVLNVFAQIATKIFDKILKLQKSINATKTARDRLLAKLMTRELELN